MTTRVVSSSKGKCKRRMCEAAMCSYKEKHMFKWPADTHTVTTRTVLVCVWKDFAQTPASTSCHAHLAGRVKVAGASIRVLTTQPVLVMDRSVTMVSVKRAVRYKCKNQNVCPISLREDVQSVK
ncbi:hypothetical protein EB796_012895 [Bugula neritina]|uniref:Uncharacterized protein n=1 Tax=Bugula neritina TaxID=10212 RepID=A0A7J7JR10_BUGNE|nr:hypothetical protein EB796_012895 [Bugula neritina]